jgi:hypothetical protein
VLGSTYCGVPLCNPTAIRKRGRLLGNDKMKIRIAITAACVGAFALAQVAATDAFADDKPFTIKGNDQQAAAKAHKGAGTSGRTVKPDATGVATKNSKKKNSIAGGQVQVKTDELRAHQPTGGVLIGSGGNGKN